MPYMFKKRNIGKLVGTTTWGGLVGIWDVPPLMDGGYITAPRGGFYDTEGNWAVENEGTSPDIRVEQEPKLIQQGHDPQLEATVKILMDELKTKSVELKPPPKDPIRSIRPE
jgi:tricorn protease